MRKTIAAASIAVTGLAVLGAGTAAFAGTRDEPDDGRGRGRVEEALSGLVDDGTITDDQAGAVADALADVRSRHGIGHRGFGLGSCDVLSTTADSLGIDEDDLRSELADGKTIAEVADERGVDVQDVVDDILAAQRKRMNRAVEEGHLTQQQADALLDGAGDRVAALVDGEMRAGGRHDPGDLAPPPGMQRPWPRPWGGAHGHHHGPSGGDSPADDPAETPAAHRDRPGQVVV